ncbi:MAG: hypothetical protein ABF380_05895, partial [Akkermansiaceae bacterium]
NFPFLGQGERVLIANNRKALEFRYGHLLTLPIVGEFGSTSGLSNGGEQLVLNSVFDFIYDDLAPWPVASDGSGYSLVLIDPLSNPDLSKPVNWRSSIEIGGIPGSDDATTLAEFSVENGIANPFLDHDGDGIATIIEYAIGSPYDIFSVENLLNFHLENDPVDPRFVIEFFIAPGADDILLAPELSLDLSTWERLPDTSYLGEIRQPDGRILRRFQTDRVISNLSSRFFRLRATQR